MSNNDMKTNANLTQNWEDYKGVSEWIHLVDRKPSTPSPDAVPAPTVDENEPMLASAYDPTVIARQTAEYHRKLEAQNLPALEA